MQSRCSIDVVKYFFGILLLRSCGWVGGGGVEKLELKLTSAKVEVEAELGNEGYVSWKWKIVSNDAKKTEL